MTNEINISFPGPLHERDDVFFPSLAVKRDGQFSAFSSALAQTGEATPTLLPQRCSCSNITVNMRDTLYVKPPTLSSFVLKQCKKNLTVCNAIMSVCHCSFRQTVPSKLNVGAKLQQIYSSKLQQGVYLKSLL